MAIHLFRKPWELIWLPAFFGGAVFGALSARAGEPAMTAMKMSDALPQPHGMDDMMMSARGLVPFGLMTGQAGDWMISYQFMFEQMDGNLDGTDDISSEEILQNFSFAPTAMTMQMHMFMVMYQPTDKLNVMVMVPYIRKDMDMLAFDGERFTNYSDGIGDIELRGTYSIYRTRDLRHEFLLKGGLGVPTGSIDETMDGAQLEYPMQLGSGTVSLLPGLTYLGQQIPWGWGADFNSTVQLGTNDHHYRFGNRYQASIWIARQVANWVSVSVTASGEYWGNVHGADPRLDITEQPTNDPNRQGGKRLDALFGITFHPETGFFKGQQFFVYGDVPVVQSLDGPQLQRSWVLRVAWQCDF
jgi:hypothetical protein